MPSCLRRQTAASSSSETNSFFSNGDYFLFYFKSDKTYTIIHICHSIWPKSLNMFDKIKLQLLDKVLFVFDGATVEGTLVAKGTQEELNKMQSKIEKKLDSEIHNRSITSLNFLNDITMPKNKCNSTDNSSDSDSDVDVMLKAAKSITSPVVIKKGLLSDGTNVTPNSTPLLSINDHTFYHNASRLLDISSSHQTYTDSNTILNKVIEVLDDLKRHLVEENLTRQATNQIMKSHTRVLKKLERIIDKNAICHSAKHDNGTATSIKIPFNINGQEINLLDVKGKRSSKYAVNTAKLIFSEEELVKGMLSPKRQGGRISLSPNRSVLLKEAVTHLFSYDNWEEATAAVNQYGLDIKRRKFH